MRNRTKSVTVEAVQWTGENVEEMKEAGMKVPSGLYVGSWMVRPVNSAWPSPISEKAFPSHYEPLPESTLDLEEIEALVSENTKSSILVLLIGRLIAEVKRLRRG